MGPVSNRYHVCHAPSLQNKSCDQGSVSVEPEVRVPYVGTHHQGFQHTLSEHSETVPEGENVVSFPYVSTTVGQLNDDFPCGVYFDNLQDFSCLGCQASAYISCATLLLIQKNLISMDLDCQCLTVLFAVPMAVALLQCTGVCGWGCPKSSRMLQKIMPVWQLWKSAPSSASTAEATTKRKIDKSA
jgi:hypothetical protein